MKDEESYLYLIEEDDGRHGFVKLGIASNPKKRLKVLQTSNPRKLILRMTVGPMPNNRARTLEQTLHKFFAGARVAGEWFKKYYTADRTILWKMQDLYWVLEAGEVRLLETAEDL